MARYFVFCTGQREAPTLLVAGPSSLATGSAAQLQQGIERPAERLLAAEVVPPQPLPVFICVEGESLVQLVRVGRGPPGVRRQERIQPRDRPIDDRPQDRPITGPLARDRLIELLPEPEAVFLEVNGVRLPAQEVVPDLLLPPHGLRPQQADRRVQVVVLPAIAAVEDRAERGPLVQQPSAAGSRRFEAVDDLPGALRAIGRSGRARRGRRRGDRTAGTRCRTGPGRRLDIQAEELPAQCLSLVDLPACLPGRHRLQDGGQAGGLDPVGPLDLPRGGGRLLDQELLDDVIGIQGLGPGVEPIAEGIGILAGQDGRRGTHAVLEGVELRPLLPLG